MPKSPPPIAPDLATLDARARERWADNWNFRAYLRQYEDPLAVDSAVHDVNREVEAAIDCTQCANCCKTISPTLTDADVSTVAAADGAPVAEFARRHLAQGEHGGHVFRSAPCPLLRGSRCSVYASRPSDCRSYPHLAEPEFLAHSDQAIENTGVCPIVFHVFERLKGRFAYDPATDYIGDEPQEVE